LDRRLGGLQSRSGRRGEEKNSHPPPGIEPQTPIVQPVAQRYTDWAITVQYTRYQVLKKNFIPAQEKRFKQTPKWIHKLIDTNFV
jgi:hypothetical protein